jgi:hypothetical protein
MVNIRCRTYSDMLEQEMVETLTASVEEEDMGYYSVASIPLFTSGLATEDIVRAEFDDEEGALTFRELIRPSGNSIIWVVLIADNIRINDVREIFSEIGCSSEKVSDRFFSLEVKAAANFLVVRDKLNELKTDEFVDYFEACLSAHHQY